MITEFQKQKKTTILDFLTKKGNRSNIFSTCIDEHLSSLPDDKIYIYSTSRELVVVDLNHYTKAESELADEVPVSVDADPLYYAEFESRSSPATKLHKIMQSIATAIKTAGLKEPRMWGVLVMNTTILNRDDLENLWDGMHLTVIDEVEETGNPLSILNADTTLPGYKWFKAIDENLPKENDKIDPEFEKLLNDFIQHEYGKLGNAEKESLLDEDEEDDEMEDVDNDPLSDLELPSGELMLNPTNTIHVEILPPMTNPREELTRLVGCKDIKNRIDELVELTNYNQMMHKLNPAGKLHVISLHGIFTGRPGTGKTTLCKIYGSLLREAGVLSKGHVVVTSRNTFIGTNWGDEERVVREVVNMAQGGVLMIDEAYLLNGDNRNDPGKVVIPLLMDILANEAERDIAIILCGYKKEMGRLIDLNPGLQSRFPNKFDFPDFTVDELLEITRRRIKDYNYHFTRSAWAKYKSLLELAYSNRDPLTWGNARFVANQLERIYVNHARRCVRARKMDQKHILTITTADIDAIEVPTAKPRIGF